LTIAKWVDTNIIVRIITNNPPEQVQQLQGIIHDVETGAVILKISSLIIAETVWVLQKQYSREEIVYALMNLTHMDGVELEEKDIIMDALRDYNARNVDFVDAYLAAKTRQHHPDRVLTWNVKDFKKLNVDYDDPGNPPLRKSAEK